MTDAAAIESADHRMRNWAGRGAGPIRLGSPQHLRLFSRMLLETHNPYKPAVMVWPELAPDALQRLTSLPIWDIAVQTEGRASIRVRTFAETVTDPLLRTALEMNAGEEARHKLVLGRLVDFYDIRLSPEPSYPPPKKPEWAWLMVGYSECIDSFFSFGLFALARQSGFFPAALVETFEPVVQEEARHILFFANWVAWYRRNLPWWRRVVFEVRVLAVWVHLIWERVGIARGISRDGEAEDANFAMTGSSAVSGEQSPRTIIDLCLKENERRMAGYDRRLLRPRTVPALARAARWFFRPAKQA